MTIHINNQLCIPEQELEIKAIRSQGAGGQNVNKVATAVHLRFDIARSSLPESCKHRLLAYADQRISEDGIVVIKAQRFRSQEKNRLEAIERLKQLILKATAVQKRRVPTKPSAGARQRRVESKTRRGKVKELRGKIDH